MGKGTIIGETGGGLYRIRVDGGSGDLTAKIQVWSNRVAQIDADIPVLENNLLSTRAATSAYWSAVDDAIGNNSATTEQSQRAELALKSAAKARDQISQLEQLRLERATLQTKIAQYAQELSSAIEEKQAWCADYTEEITGEVATIELDGEGPLQLIAPGGEEYTTAAGDFRDRLAMSATTTYLNALLLPGWQKYSPTYRCGYLVSINREANTAVVNLEPAESSAQNLNINQTESLNDVPFEYLNCDNLAFEVGDDVVVQFVNQDWSLPKVIGFKSNPRPCGPERVWFPVGFDGSTVLDSYSDLFNIGLWTRSTGVDGVTTQEWRSGDFSDGPPGPGFNWFGDARPSGGSNTATIRIIYGGGGVLASISGDGPSAAWRTDYTCALGDAVLSSQQVAAWTEIGNGLLATDIRAINTLSYIPQPDGEWNRDYVTMNPSSPPTFYDERELDATGLAAIAAKNAYMATYFGNPPSPITLTTEGGGGVVYEFMRWGIIGEQSKPFNSEFPAVQAFGGLAAIYRLRR